MEAAQVCPPAEEFVGSGTDGCNIPGKSCTLIISTKLLMNKDRSQ